MKIFKPNSLEVFNYLKNIDDDLIRKMALAALKIKRTETVDDLYEKFYASKYYNYNYQKALALDNHLESLLDNGYYFTTSNQGEAYKFIKININNQLPTMGRFYLGVTPDNIHEVVAMLTDKFLQNHVSVKFKYQLEGKRGKSDRIIIYHTEENKKEIEDVLTSISKEKPNLFLGSERTLGWAYESKIPNVYYAPEVGKNSYGYEFANAMKEAKDIFCYLEGINNQTPKKEYRDDDVPRIVDLMEKIVSSTLLRNGLMISKDDIQIRAKNLKDRNIKTYYDYNTGILTNVGYDEDSRTMVSYLGTKEGKEAFLNNFYNVSLVNETKDVKVTNISKANNLTTPKK